jgi:hypothetical protein
MHKHRTTADAVAFVTAMSAAVNLDRTVVTRDRLEVSVACVA